MKPFYCSKKFLNIDGYNSDASIFCQLNFYSDDSPSCDATLKIKDCSNAIHLQVGVYEEDSSAAFDNSLFKIDTLISELAAFREALISGREEYIKRLEKQKKERQDEMDSRNNNNTSLHSSDSPPSSTSDGLDNIQGAIHVTPNI
jgi:hypothetical protein